MSFFYYIKTSYSYFKDFNFLSDYMYIMDDGDFGLFAFPGPRCSHSLDFEAAAKKIASPYLQHMLLLALLSIELYSR